LQARSHIAFVLSSSWALGATDCCAELRVITPDGSGQRTLTRFAAMYSASPVWSPDGRRIAFMTAPGFSEEIAVINANGSGKRILTYHPASDHGPVWSPDGRKIAFTRASYSQPVTTTVVVTNADGSGKRILAHGSGPVWTGGRSPSGATAARCTS
jgi:Tol biopolymer transport system component